MNTLQIIGCAIVIFFFSAFKSISSCEYAASNINFVKTQTEKAIGNDSLELVRYHSFKALKAIEQSKEKLKVCKCEYASISIEESAYLIKRATKLHNVDDAKDLLKRALENVLTTIDALNIHEEEHTHKDSDKLLALNSEADNENYIGSETTTHETYKQKIDTSLEKYRTSLDKVVRTVDCNEAREFAEKIYQTCEQELLKDGLSEPKKYYNLKTKEITAEALERISAKCDK